MSGGFALKRRFYFFFIAVGLVAIIISLFAGRSQGNQTTKIEEREGLIYLIGDNDAFTGKITDTLYNKVLEYEVFKGKKNGIFKLSGLNGKVEMVGKIVDNLNEGEWKYYFTNGQLESIGNFTKNLSEGKWTWYFENGSVREIGHFKSGKKDGYWTIFDEKGNVSRKIYFKDGQITLDQNFDKDTFS